MPDLKLGKYLVVGFVAVVVALFTPQMAPSGTASLSDRVPDEIIVKLAPGVNVESENLVQLHSKVGAKARSPFRILQNYQVVKLPAGMGYEEARLVYEASPLVTHVEPNFLYKAFGQPEDPLFSTQWGLYNDGSQGGQAGADIGAIKAWDIARGDRRIVVAVIDTGVDYTHPDLTPNVWKNPGETGNGRETDGIDNDGNGFIDDVYGWNFYSNTKDPKDDNGHGTHCAGVIGAAHNSIGIRGVASDVSIMSIKFLGAGGNGTLEAGLLAVEYAVLNGAQILSNSWGGDGYSQAFYDLIEIANRRGILFVAASGNDHSNNDTQPTYPAAYTNANMITVAANDRRDVPAVFTNWGMDTVHLSAPGVKIMSTVLRNEYRAYSGTSMACPHVAGALAVLKSDLPNFTHLQLKERILATVDKSVALTRLVSSGGRLNLYNALMNVNPDPRPEPEQWITVGRRISSPHPYPSLSRLQWQINHPGARAIKIHFSKLHTEQRVDGVILRDRDGKVVETLSGNQGELWSRPIEGDSVVIQLLSDSLNEFYGFDIDQYAYQ
jgi:thermitase